MACKCNTQAVLKSRELLNAPPASAVAVGDIAALYMCNARI